MATGKQFDFLLAGLRDPATDGPLNAGTVETYAADGTFTTGKVAYKTSDTTGLDWGAAITLDAYGRAQAWGDGQYDLKIKNAAGTVVYTMEGYDAYYSQTVASGKLDADSPTLDSGNLAMAGGKIVNLAAGTASTDAVRVAEAALTSQSNTFIGQQTIKDSTGSNGITIRVDSIGDVFLSYLQGHTIVTYMYFVRSEDYISAADARIRHVLDPTGEQDAATKKYVDENAAPEVDAGLGDTASGTNTGAIATLTGIAASTRGASYYATLGALDVVIVMHGVREGGSAIWYHSFSVHSTATGEFQCGGGGTSPTTDPVWTATVNSKTFDMFFLVDTDTIAVELAFGAATTNLYSSIVAYYI